MHMKEKIFFTIFNEHSRKYTIDFKSDAFGCSKRSKLSTILFYNYAPNFSKSA